MVGSWDGQLYVYDDAGTLLPGWPIRVGDQIISSAARSTDDPFGCWLSDDEALRFCGVLCGIYARGVGGDDGP